MTKPASQFTALLVAALAAFSLLACSLLACGCSKRSGDLETSDPSSARAPARESHGEGATGSPEPPSGAPGGDGADALNSASPAPSGRVETVVLAGGCFWGMEEILRGVDGILETEVGYAGGETPQPTYGDVKTGATGHAESVRVRFDPERLSFERLLLDWFFKMHDPTTRDRQGNDVGSQYRSAIFVTQDEQLRTAKHVIARIDDSGAWGAPIVTELSRLRAFTPAEEEHQDYLQKHPGGYTCHYLRDLSL